MKCAENLTVYDLAMCPIWEFTNIDELGETMVRPVEKIPVNDSRGKLIGVVVIFSNGFQSFAKLGNINSKDPYSSEQLMIISIEKKGVWFNLARYFDLDYVVRGPEALSKFLNLSIDEIFPISFDVRKFVEGVPAALKGSIPREPRVRLARSEIIKLAAQQ